MSGTTFVSDATVSGLEGISGTEKRAYHGTPSSIYALPADAHEYDRLEKQHHLILHLFDGPISAPASLLSQLDNGGRVLDVGCGPGDWIKLVAQEHPKAEAHAADFAPTYKPGEEKDSPASRVTFQLGNILHRLPYDDNYFDFIQMRFFTGALKVGEWPVAVAEIYRIIKPGGWVQLVEPDGELRTYLPEGVSETLRDWNERGMRGSLRKRGGEPNAGVSLAEYVRKAGFKPDTIRADNRSVTLSFRAVDGLHIAPEAKAHQQRLAKMMIDDYRELVRTLAPILCTSWDITPQDMVAWGEKVLQEADVSEAYHDFVTCVAQK